MMWVAVGGLAVNLASFAVLHGADHGNLNVRAPCSMWLATCWDRWRRLSQRA